MSLAKLTAIAAAITETEVQRASIAELIAARQQSRAVIVNDIAAAQSDLDSLNPTLETLLASEAVGEDVADALDAARAAAAAGKRLTGARKREPEARDLSLAENGLQRHLGVFDDRLGELRTQHEQARIDYIRGVATKKADAYRDTAIPRSS